MSKKKLKKKKLHDKTTTGSLTRDPKKQNHQKLPYCQISGTAEHERFNAPDEPCDDGTS